MLYLGVITKYLLIIKKNRVYFINAIVIFLLFIWPYIVFGDLIRLEGDDSRLYYIYPEYWINNVANSSWISFSSLPKYDTQYFFLPILYIFYLFKLSGVADFVIMNTVYSLISILGLIFYQKFFSEYYGGKNNDGLRLDALLGGLIFIFSPIILVTPMRAFLGAVWLIPIIPAVLYYLLRYVKTGLFINCFTAAVILMIGSIASNAIPWMLGIILPITLAGIIIRLCFCSYINNIVLIKRFLFFLILTILLQTFWLFSFFGSVTSADDSLGARIFDREFSDTFTREVDATSRGISIVYPLLNLFHLQLQRNFSWPSLNTYEIWYESFTWLSFMYILVVFYAGYLYQRRQLNRLFKYDKKYLFLLLAFLISLFLFTVNIGSLKKLFLSFGELPGFVMFRNFYDKFALGYAFIYATLIGYSLIIIRKSTRSRTYSLIVTLVFLSVAINSKPLFTGEILDAAYSKTNIGKLIHFPQSYIDFMRQVGYILPNSSNILSIPFGTSAYTTIYDSSTGNLFSGKSPVKLFSGINDFSGNLSFPPNIARVFDALVLAREYDKLRSFLDVYHIHYAVETEYIPSEFLATSNYDKSMLAAQDSQFKENLYTDVLFESGGYRLLSLSNIENNNVFSVPKSLYSFERNSSLDNEVVALLPFISSDNVLINSNDAIPTQTIRKLVDTSVLGENDSLLYTGNEYFVLTRSEFMDKIEITRGYEELLPVSKKSITSIPVDSRDYVVINENIVDFEQLNRIGITRNDSIGILSPIKTSDLLHENSWVSGDCNAYNDERATTADFQKDKIVLTAKNLHNSCIHTNIENIHGGERYLIQLDADSTEKEIQVYIKFNTGEVIERTMKVESESVESYYRVYVEVPDQSSSATVYLYSGKSINIAETKLSEITLSHLNLRTVVTLPNSDRNNSSVKVSADAGYYLSQQKPELYFYEDSDFQQWSRGDCGAIDNELSTSFLVESGSNRILLQSSGGHNACINKEFAISSAYGYTVSFKTKSDNQFDAFVYVDYGDDAPPQKDYIKLSASEVEHVIKIIPNKNAKKFRVYLYSGSGNKILSSIEYSDFRINKQLLFYENSFLIDDKPIENSAEKNISIRNIEKIANHAYLIKLHQTGSGLLHFVETFNSGWNIYPYNENQPWQTSFFREPLNVKHVKINNYSNGWWLDNKDCNNLAGCDIQYLVVFTPQRWFYVGLIISGVTLASCLGYLGYSGVQSYRRRKATKGNLLA